MSVGQRSTGRLALSEPVYLPAKLLGLDVGGLDHPIPHPDSLTGGGAQLHLVAEQPVSGIGRADTTLGHGDAVLVQLGVDPLSPGAALIG